MDVPECGGPTIHRTGESIGRRKKESHNNLDTKFLIKVTIIFKSERFRGKQIEKKEKSKKLLSERNKVTWPHKLQ